MAKIPVEKETGGGGWWKWLLGLLLLALIIWLLWSLFDTDEADVAVDDADVEQVEPQVGADAARDRTAQGAAAGAAASSVGDILSNPDQYIGQTFPDTEVDVGSVPTDRGFWITDQGDSLFAVIIDQPREQPKDVNPGQALRVQDGTLRDSEYLSEMPGEPLDQATRRIAEQQDIFLVVDERYITVLQGGRPQPGTDPAEGVQ